MALSVRREVATFGDWQSALPETRWRIECSVCKYKTKWSVNSLQTQARKKVHRDRTGHAVVVMREVPGTEGGHDYLNPDGQIVEQLSLLMPEPPMKEGFPF